MIEELFAGLPHLYRKGAFTLQTSFYFSIDEVKMTLTLDADTCSAEEGKRVENADCVCKTSEEFFLKIWNEGYRPGMKDFLSGAIKSNAPQLLQQFMQAFGKS